MSLRAPFVRPVLMTEYLFTAVQEGNLPRLSQIFLNSKADPNCRNADGKPLIVYAAEQGFAQGMEKILAHPRANPNLKDRNGQAALHVTARKGDLVGTKILVEGGGIKNIRDNGQYSPLHHAVKEGRIEIVDYLVNDPDGKHKHTGPVNIDAVANDKTTPLLQACYNSNLPLVKMLVEAGARTNWRDSEGYTAKAIAVFKGWDKQIGAELPMDPFTSEFIRRKVLAHCNGIGSRSEIDKTLFSLEGAYSPYMHQMMQKQLQLYFQTAQCSLLDSQKNAILKAFELSGPNIPAQDVVDRIQGWRLAIMQGGWKRHAIDLVFFGDYMAIGNRGEGIPEGYKTIEVVKIDRKLVTKDIIEEIRSQKNKDCAHASSYFYFDLPAKLAGAGMAAAVKDDLCRKISEFAPKPIHQGTCTFAAAKAAARASMMLLTMSQIEKSRYHSRAWLCRQDSKMASMLGRLDALKQYLHSHFHEPHPDGKKPLDEILVRRCFFKTTKHVNTTRGSIRDLFESRIKELKRDYPAVFMRKPPGF
ncbi:MAG: ankyrin repeat domain-containing protein [Verrucomicrobia bacterium]|nr:ankyrin repeat domain-containing protein [Verrucomicrobiota bacterium]